MGLHSRDEVGGPRRVLLISNRVMHYRVAVYNYFWKRFRDNGWEFSVVSDELQSTSKGAIEFPFEELPFRFRDYRKYIAEYDPDVVILFLRLHDRILWPLLHALRFRERPACVVWTKTRNLDRLGNPIRNLLFDYVMHLADGILVYSSALMKYVPESKQNLAFVANNTLNYHSFPVIAETKWELKKRLGYEKKKIVLFVGRMGEMGNRKKVDHIIDVFRSLSDPNYRLIIVGSGMPTELRAAMNTDNTTYLGEVQDENDQQISELFKAADLCCVPGHVGLSLNQAFFWGLPMVTEAGPQPPEIQYLRSGENGYLVPEDNVDELGRRVKELLDNDGLREEFSRNAKQTLFEEASIEGMYESFRSCVEMVAGGKSPGGT